jgi:hypothetical protein
MGRHARRTRRRYDQAASRDPGRGQRRVALPPAPAASASLPAGNAVPSQRQEAPPERWSAEPEEGRSIELRVPAQAHWREKDHDDGVQLSIYTDADGQRKTYSVSGIDRASNALNGLILRLGLAVALIFGSPAAFIYILAQHSTREKVIYGLVSAAVSGGVWIGSRAVRWLKGPVKRRRRQRRSKASADSAGHG